MGVCKPFCHWSIVVTKKTTIVHPHRFVMALPQWHKVQKPGEDELHRPPLVALKPSMDKNALEEIKATTWDARHNIFPPGGSLKDIQKNRLSKKTQR